MKDNEDKDIFSLGIACTNELFTVRPGALKSEF